MMETMTGPVTVPDDEPAPDEDEAVAERLSEDLDAADVYLPWLDKIGEAA